LYASVTNFCLSVGTLEGTVRIDRFHPGDASGSGSGTFCLGLVIALARKSGAKKVVIFPQKDHGMVPLLKVFGFQLW